MPSAQEQKRRLEVAMDQLGKSRADLQRAGLKKTTLSRILSTGDRGIGGKTATRLALALDLRVEYFLSDKSLSLEEAMIRPPRSSAAEKHWSTALSPAFTLESIAIRERFLVSARQIGRVDVVNALLDASPPEGEAENPMWWLDLFTRAVAANGPQKLPAIDTPPPKTTTVPKKSVG